MLSLRRFALFAEFLSLSFVVGAALLYSLHGISMFEALIKKPQQVENQARIPRA